MNYKKAKKYAKAALRVASDVIPKLPTKEDTPLSVFIKLIGIVDSATRFNTKGNIVLSFFDALNAEERRNGQFVDLFFNTPVKDAFDMELIELDEYRSIRIAHKEGFGTLYFIEYRWGSRPEVSDDFWASHGFPYDRVLEVLWEIFEGQMHIEVKHDEQKNRPITHFTAMSPITDPIIGRNAEMLEGLKKRHQRFKDQGRQCTYLFLGKQGVGKTTLAQRLAESHGGRCMRVDAGGLTTVGVHELDFLVNQLRPGFLLIDDIDKCTNVAAVLPTLLSLLADFRAKHPELTVILTAAVASGLDPALVRPRRIDKIVEFELPDEKEREAILRGYGVAEISVRELAKATEELTAAYLQGIAESLSCGDTLKEVLKDVELMKELAKNAPAAGGLQPVAEESATNIAVKA